VSSNRNEHNLARYPAGARLLEQSVWESMKKREAQAHKKVVNLVSEARGESPSRAPGVRLVVWMDHQRRIPKFEIEDIEGSEQAAADDHAALAEARERGVSRAAEILEGAPCSQRLNLRNSSVFRQRIAEETPTTGSPRPQSRKTRTPFSQMADHVQPGNKSFPA
jgi:hypothetical protein